MPTLTPPSTDELIRFVDTWQSRRIVVVGDFMLDHYVYGNADRLSPDAPVPILAVEREEWKPGGAANVALDLAALRCEVVCLGIVGDDHHGRELVKALAAAGCTGDTLVRVPGRPTTVKQNFVGLAQHRHPQKMFRVDIEDRSPVDERTAARLLAAATDAMTSADALCIEDYNKGVLTDPVCHQLIELARSRGVPVLVDPAAVRDYARYRGSTCITPNRTEAALATGLPPDQTEAMAQKLLDGLDLETVVLTLDKQGALLLDRHHPPLQVPTQARAVYDVTGAGDMVLAMLAAARANGADWPAAVALANAAAGLEVEKFGVVPIPIGEVLLSLLRQRHEQIGKVRTLEQLLPELDAYRRQGKTIGFTNGCFDILHAGHVAYLRRARQAADLLVVGVNSDSSIRRIKGPDRPVNHQEDRVMVLSELQSVDYLVVFDHDTPIDLIRAVRPDVLIKGADYSREQVVGADLVESYGGRIELVELVEGRSTTNIIRRIESANRKDA
jgi:D-beta-D-heptose 7-phosphate kinase/D-beta-D-heptose 1-phosphate adenosyltransferase